MSRVNDTCATAAAAGTISNGAVAFVTRTLGPGNTTDHFRMGAFPAGGQPPIAPGTTLRFQARFRDAADPTGFGLSHAPRVTLTP